MSATASCRLNNTTAALAGVLVATAVQMVRVSSLTALLRSTRGDAIVLVGTAAATVLLDEHIVAYRIDGPIFFGAAHDFLLELTEVSGVRVVVLRMARVTVIDATGASVLADTISRLEARGITVLLSGVRPQHERVLRELGVHVGLAHERHLFTTTPAAIEHARLHASRVAHSPGGAPRDEEAERGARQG
ncbi:MAG: sodium-independent anion transporter [Humibacillus sp.]